MILRPLALLALLVATMPLSARGETLTNPSFEAPFPPLPVDPLCPSQSGAVASGWFDNSCWSGNQGAFFRYSRDSIGAHSGGSAQRIRFACTGVVQLAQSVGLSAGRAYTLSLWMRADTATSVHLGLRQEGPPYFFYLDRAFVLTPTWTRYEVSGLAESTAAFVMIHADVPGAFEIDDASLTSAPFSTPLPAEPVPGTFFGMHLHRAAIPFPDRSLPIGCVRLWDAGGFAGHDAQWADVNPAPGVFDWTGIDAHLARAEANHADVVFNLARTPRWASARPDEASPYGPGQAAEPANIQSWRDWVAAAANRYRGRVKYWEIWNEPGPGFYTGTSASLVTLAREAHTILKNVDPANTIVTPSYTDLAGLDAYLAAGGGAWADVMSYHFYIIGSAPEVLVRSYIPSARLILQRYGQSAKPLWNTEAGWFAPTALGDEIGAAYVARSYLLNWASGVKRFYWYEWDGDSTRGINLSRLPGFNAPTASGVAYAEVARWLIGARMTSLDSDTAGTWILALARADGSTSRVIWNTGATAASPRPFVPPAAWGVTRQRTLAGVESALPNGASVPIEGRPRLLLQLPLADVAPGADPHASLRWLGGGSLRFELPTTANVTLTIFDLQGRAVATLARGRFGAGAHEARFDALARRSKPGVYFARLSGDFGETRVVRIVIGW